MKRFLILILGLVLGVQAFGQNGVYSEVLYLDKFDDVAKDENIKTLVEKTDSTFIIETKGGKQDVYYILNLLPAGCYGDKDNIVNLTGNVYGYQTCWAVVRGDMIDEYRTAHEYVFWKSLEIEANDELDVEEKLQQQSNEFSKLEKYYLFIIHRVITTQYSHTYQGEYLWVQDDTNTKLGKDINRIIYKK